MKEERLYQALLALLRDGAQIEERTDAGRRFAVVHHGEKQPISGALAVKLQAAGLLRPLCRLNGKTLWVGAAG